MAVKFASNNDGDLDETHEINVTPFIDVILVLLIIFMVAAPLSTVDVNVDLPTSTAQPTQRPEKPLFLTIKSDLSLNLGDKSVSHDGLAAALDAATNGDKDQRIYRPWRQDGRLWAGDGSDESLARCGLSEDRARRA